MYSGAPENRFYLLPRARVFSWKLKSPNDFADKSWDCTVCLSRKPRHWLKPSGLRFFLDDIMYLICSRLWNDAYRYFYDRALSRSQHLGLSLEMRTNVRPISPRTQHPGINESSPWNLLSIVCNYHRRRVPCIILHHVCNSVRCCFLCRNTYCNQNLPEPWTSQEEVCIPRRVFLLSWYLSHIWHRLI